VKQVSCIAAVPKHRRLVCGSRQLKVFEYKKPFTPELSDDYPILCSKYSSIRMEIYVAGDKNIKVWNARMGKPVREMKQCMSSVITCMEFDQDHRELIVGDHSGAIKIFDILSGVTINVLESHKSEISYLGYARDDKIIVSCSWDSVIKIHTDQKSE